MADIALCTMCDTPLLHDWHGEEEAKCDSCTLMQRKLECFYPLLDAACIALTNLPNIATPDTIGSVAYHETRMKLLLAIDAFEGNRVENDRKV